MEPTYTLRTGRYTIPVPILGRITYHAGEVVPKAHYQLVPKADRKLFQRNASTPSSDGTD